MQRKRERRVAGGRAANIVVGEARVTWVLQRNARERTVISLPDNSASPLHRLDQRLAPSPLSPLLTHPPFLSLSLWISLFLTSQLRPPALSYCSRSTHLSIVSFFSSILHLFFSFVGGALILTCDRLPALHLSLLLRRHSEKNGIYQRHFRTLSPPRRSLEILGRLKRNKSS